MSAVPAVAPVSGDDLAALAGLTGPERRCALLLVMANGGDVRAAATAARELAPRDELEARLCALVQGLTVAATHELALGDGVSSVEYRARSLGLVDRLAGRAVQAIEALTRMRRPPEQRVVVEHVHIHAGGQAIVGAVEHGGGGGGGDGTGHQPHARALAHAPEPALRGADPGRELLPVAGGEGQAAMQDARRVARQRRPRGRAERPVEARPAERRGAGGAGGAAAAAQDGEGGAGG